jgi:hypothetical protein
MRAKLLLVLALATSAYAADVLRDAKGNPVNIGSGTISDGKILWTDCEGTTSTYAPAGNYRISKGGNCPKIRGVSARTGSGFCSQHMPVRRFVVDASGAVNDTGRTLEGPACIEVFYNPIQSYVSLATNTTTVNGPDLSKVVTGSSASGGAAPETRSNNISSAFKSLQDKERLLSGALRTAKSSYTTGLQKQEKAIAKISLLRRVTKLRSASELPKEVKNGYAGLQDDLKNALAAVSDFLPTDMTAPGAPASVLSQLEQISDSLARLPLTFSNRPKPATDTTTRKVVCSSDPVPLDKPEKDLTPKEENRDLSWADWSAACKTDFDQFKAIVDSEIQDAKNYTDSSDNTKLFKARASVVQYWDALFSSLGLSTKTTIPSDDWNNVDIAPFFYARTGVKCGVLFNQTANTAVNIVAADLGPTLDGKDPDIKAQGAFVTVSCGTPFSISAGVGFSTIRQQEFAIVKSAGTPTTSVNTFGVVNDSRITPMPMVMANVRLYDWAHHKYAFHGSFGISGNLQNNASGGSAAEFLPAGTFSFWRTMYVSLGPQIGTKSELAGGFSVGQQVPSDITTINGQVKRSRTVGFGFAITFTKP